DAQRDKEIVEAELILADLQTLDKQVEPRGVADKEVKARWEVVIRLKEELNKGNSAHTIVVEEREKELIKDLHLLTMKPVLYVENVSEMDLSSKSKAASLKTDKVIISAKIESELAGLPESEQKEYLKSLGLEKSGLERLIQKAYQKLNLISFLTGGELEARAWTIPLGTKAPQAAGVIHTDFEKGFIKAEVIDYVTFVKLEGWSKARELGKMRFEGKEYQMQDGDVVEFKVNS
ncbi:MAG: DUF933 domain-containing protein, partial [Patescibacteria group bacterium]